MKDFGNCLATANMLLTDHETSSIVTMIINILLTLTATLGNGIIIIAILKSQNLQTPSYLLITSLAFADLLVGFVFHPSLIVVHVYSLAKKFEGICELAQKMLVVVFFLSLVSLLMVTCISIDRYLALTLRHRYTIIVTKKRARLLIVLVWIVALVHSLVITWAKEQFIPLFMFTCAFALVLLSITCVCYIKSFRALHLYTVQVHAQQANPLAGNFDVVRYKKTLKTMLVVLACLLLCFLPAICSFFAMSFVGLKSFLYSLSICLMGLNSSLNPVIYYIRFPDIRNTCRQKLRSLVH